MNKSWVEAFVTKNYCISMQPKTPYACQKHNRPMDRRLSMSDRTSAIPFSTRNEGGFPERTELQTEFQNSNATLEILGRLAISQNLNN